MEDYNKVIESLGVRYIKAKNLVLQQPFTVRNSYDMGNNIILLHKGRIAFGDEDQVVEEGEMLFIPGGRATKVTYGHSPGKVITNDDLITNKDKFFHSNSDLDLIGDAEESHSFVSFEAKVFDSVNFFSSLDVPAFLITNNSKLANLVIKVVEESLQTCRVGSGSLRFIPRTSWWKSCATSSRTRCLWSNWPPTALTSRILALSTYSITLRENIGGDLSNKVLSGVANVSEDYVGQYFKMLTGINPQDYIEYQRMERAVFLLRTTKKSIRDIGKEVGYKDTAYFCRRFKMMFGIPAGKMRRRESAMNI